MTPEGVLCYMQSMKTSKLPRRQLEQLQARKLRDALRYAYANLPAFNETLRRIGFHPEDLKRVEDVRRLPMSSKADIMKRRQDALAAGRTRGVKLVSTSGTTGQSAVLVRTTERTSVNVALNIRSLLQIGLRPWSRVATLWAPARYWKTLTKDGETKPLTGLDYVPVRFFGRTLPNILTIWVDPNDPARDGRTIADFRPDFVYSRPSHLRRIARYCGAEHGIEPKVIVMAGEIMSKTAFDELHASYGAKIVRNYGSAEMGKLGADCLYERGIHTWEDYKLYEVLKDGEPVAPGEVGELVVSDLFRDTFPIFRYRTGDFVRLGGYDRCECGSCTMRLSSIEGRENDCVIGEDGERFLATEVSDRLESEFGLRDFQLVQNSLNEFTLLLRADDIERRKEVSGVKEYLEEIAGSQ